MNKKKSCYYCGTRINEGNDLSAKTTVAIDPRTKKQIRLHLNKCREKFFEAVKK